MPAIGMEDVLTSVRHVSSFALALAFFRGLPGLRFFLVLRLPSLCFELAVLPLPPPEVVEGVEDLVICGGGAVADECCLAAASVGIAGEGWGRGGVVATAGVLAGVGAVGTFRVPGLVRLPGHGPVGVVSAPVLGMSGVVGLVIVGVRTLVVVVAGVAGFGRALALGSASEVWSVGLGIGSLVSVTVGALVCGAAGCAGSGAVGGQVSGASASCAVLCSRWGVLRSR